MKKFIYTFVILAFVSSVSAQWMPINNGLPTGTYVQSLTKNSSYIFAGLRPTSSGLYRSNNNGGSWDATSLISYNIYSIATSGANVFVGTSANGIYRSTNNGTTFTQVFIVAGSGDVCLAINGSYIFAGFTGPDGGVYLSTNNGNNWIKTSLSNYAVKSLAINGNNIFAGTNSDGVYLSTNNGSTWTQTSLNNKNVRSIAIYSSGIIFAGTQGDGVYLSTNNGTTWTQTNLNNQNVNSLVTYGNNIFAGTSSSYSLGIFRSTNNGNSWILVNEGFVLPISINSLLIANSYIFAGTEIQSLWRRPLSEVIGIQNISTEIPSKYSLSQNYPNPFNPTTKIRFDVLNVKQASLLVTLIVYDAMGREVQTLVNESLQPGTYETSFDGSQLTTGVYFYKLITGGFTETKKMLMIK